MPTALCRRAKKRRRPIFMTPGVVVSYIANTRIIPCILQKSNVFFNFPIFLCNCTWSQTDKQRIKPSIYGLFSSLCVEENLKKIFRRTARHAGFRARSAQFSPEGAVCFYENKRFMLKWKENHKQRLTKKLQRAMIYLPFWKEKTVCDLLDLSSY